MTRITWAKRYDTGHLAGLTVEDSFNVPVRKIADKMMAAAPIGYVSTDLFTKATYTIVGVTAVEL